ncbi:hypothetical protein GQ43DRAFT_498183 [Delitschia confertaspora ATCC 74209]|uniref:C2H2-type domain-containing protein n=1 Tax=Delitschia confertaspora ATCC 74209 TaxID=1513339 RepID=A0A9P4MXY4_9PLEO|nr:hypothetical protein GQ43DRAFT_498183 [Delitschia confertaspora ATCC 74209]
MKPNQGQNCKIASTLIRNSVRIRNWNRISAPITRNSVNWGASFRPTIKKPVISQWNCHVCGKNFTKNFHPRNHILSHNGARLHACLECGKAFIRLNEMKRHQKIHDRR